MKSKSVLLVGIGRFGKHLADKLLEHGHEVMAIDINEKRIDSVANYVTNAQIGDATNELFLKSLGINTFDICMVTIGGDFQSSLETTSLLKELGAKKVIARAESDVQAKFLLRNGADEIVYPEKQLASWMTIKYCSNHILDYIEIDEDHGIFEVSIPKNWIGKTIGEVDIRKKYGINIMAIRINGVMDFRVNPNLTLQEGQTLMVLGDLKTLKKCFNI